MNEEMELEMKMEVNTYVVIKIKMQQETERNMKMKIQVETEKRWISKSTGCPMYLETHLHTCMRRLWSALWLTHFAVVRLLVLWHAIVVCPTLSGTLCICIRILRTWGCNEK